MATSTLGSGTLVLAGTTSGTTTVTATAVAGTTTLTLPAATDTLVGKATTDTLTNKTLTGAVMNGTLGATTPSTVAATTISASSTATFAAGAAGTPSITTTGDTNTGIFFPAADTIAFAEGGAESARFDSSGNFGLGVTPSAWTTSFGFKALDIGQGCVLGATSDANLVFNAYFNTSNNWIYKTTAEAGRYQQSGANHIWYTAPSGTAGNTATFSERMRLDTSGNLGLGVTPSGWPAGRPAIEIGGTTTGNLAFNGNNTNGYQIWNNSYYNGSVSIYKYNGYATNFGAGGNGSFFWSLAPSGTAGGTVTFTQAMTLDASGNLLLAGTSQRQRITVGTTTITSTTTPEAIDLGATYSSVAGQNLKLYTYNDGTIKHGIGVSAASSDYLTASSGKHTFYTGTTASMTIDSSGNLLVARTNATFYGGGVKLGVEQTSGSAWGIGINANGNAIVFNHTGNTSTAVGSITVTTSATTYNTSSDYRLKDITGSVTGAKDFIMALKPKQGTWKSDGSKFVGFLAHEFQEVSPTSVSGIKDAVDADGKPIMQSMQASSSEVIANLVAHIQNLETRLAALESK
jgi:hypothetical protein